MNLPRLFVGSSSEGSSIASAIRRELTGIADVVLWSKGVFGLGDATLEALVRASEQFDFAVLVLTPDDLTSSRRRTQQSPRDNVLFECGLFMGRLGRHRTFVAFDQSGDIKIPSDLAGITLAGFVSKKGRQPRLAVRPACLLIADAIARLGPLRSPLPAAWHTFVGNPVRLVLGRFSQFNDYEKTGLLGAGDAAALAEVSSFLRSRGAGDIETRFADQDSDLASNMLILGGPDANPLTKEVLGHTGATIGVDGITIVDRQTARRYDAISLDNTNIATDRGAILSAPNPFSTRHRVIALFGCFGFGTWAAARFVTRPELWPDNLAADADDFEAIISAPVVNGGPQQARIEMFRPLATPSSRPPRPRSGMTRSGTSAARED